MSKVKMISPAVPNVPWQDKPEGHTGAPVWRYSENPIIGRNPVEGVARIFNSAVMPYGDEFIGVFRGEQVNGIPYIYMGRSKDAIHWDFDKDKIQFVDEEGKPFMPIYAYDPRLVKVEDTYYIIWCQDFTVQPSVLRKLRISRRLPESRIRFSPLTVTPYCSTEKYTVIS